MAFRNSIEPPTKYFSALLFWFLDQVV